MFLAGEAHGIALEGLFFYYHDLGMTKRPEVFQPPVLMTTNPFLKTDICGYAGILRQSRYFQTLRYKFQVRDVRSYWVLFIEKYYLNSNIR